MITTDLCVCVAIFTGTYVLAHVLVGVWSTLERIAKALEKD